MPPLPATSPGLPIKISAVNYRTLQRGRWECGTSETFIEPMIKKVAAVAIKMVEIGSKSSIVVIGSFSDPPSSPPPPDDV